jgi:rubrerythrin
MEKANSELLDGLRQAMQAERTGETFYRHAAKTTDDPQGRVVFARLADEEAEHFAFLLNHYESLRTRGELGTATLGHAGALDGASPIFSADFQRRIQDAHFEMSALAIATQLELNGIRHYGEMAKRATEPKVRAFFEELVAWEGKHYEALLRQQKMVQDDYWAAAGFEPF